MEGWGKICGVVLAAVVLASLLIVFVKRFCFRRSGGFDESGRGKDSIHAGINSLHPVYSEKNSGFQDDIERRSNYYVQRNGVVAKPLFSWSDQPWLISEAGENGWVRFAFSSYSSTLLSSSAAVIRDLSPAQGYKRAEGAEFSWEVTSGASESMQKIKFNAGSKNDNPSGVCYAKAALPLPGPPLGNHSFPQEAYFEITILREGEDQESAEGEKITLVSAGPSITAQPDSSVPLSSSRTEKRTGRDTERLISLGLTSSSPPPFMLPGNYTGSIGFISNGSVHLDGSKLASETKQGWGIGERIIGCGFDPKQQKVIFTLDSQLVHQIHCKSEEFGSPLYPILAATGRVTVLVNLGQSSFQYQPAELQRTPNPCFLRPRPPARPASDTGNEDSRELFSMERIDDPRWLAAKQKGYDENMTVDSEDLFEIVLDERVPSRLCG